MESHRGRTVFQVNSLKNFLLILPLFYFLYMRNLLLLAHYQRLWDRQLYLLSIKRVKNVSECSAYRPISLLNVDSKIFAKILAHRLETVLPLLVSDDQTGFIKNRYSFYNIRRLLNIIHHPTPSDTPEVLLSLDAEKAFDRVEWDYLFYTLKKFGFGTKFISWIRILYSSPVAANSYE